MEGAQRKGWERVSSRPTAGALGGSCCRPRKTLPLRRGPKQCENTPTSKSVHQHRPLRGQIRENYASVHRKWVLGGRTAENRWSVHQNRALGGRTGKKPASVHQKRALGGRTGAGGGRKGCGLGAETKKAPRRSFFVPGAGVEPAQPLQPLVFETSASTDSAIRAMWRQVCAVNELQK